MSTRDALLISELFENSNSQTAERSVRIINCTHWAADELRISGTRRRHRRVDSVCRFLCGDEGEQRPSLDNVVQ